MRCKMRFKKRRFGGSRKSRGYKGFKKHKRVAKRNWATMSRGGYRMS